MKITGFMKKDGKNKCEHNLFNKFHFPKKQLPSNCRAVKSLSFFTCEHNLFNKFHFPKKQLRSNCRAVKSLLFFTLIVLLLVVLLFVDLLNVASMF